MKFCEVGARLYQLHLPSAKIKTQDRNNQKHKIATEKMIFWEIFKLLMTTSGGWRHPYEEEGHLQSINRPFLNANICYFQCHELKNASCLLSPTRAFEISTRDENARDEKNQKTNTTNHQPCPLTSLFTFMQPKIRLKN